MIPLGPIRAAWERGTWWPAPITVARVQRGLTAAFARIGAAPPAHADPAPAASPAHRFWNEPLAQHADIEHGLSDAEATRLLAQYGPNNSFIRRRDPLWRVLLDRFLNPLVLILLFASALSALSGQIASFTIIVLIITLSVALDVTQQRRAENVVEALRQSVSVLATVVRSGRKTDIPVDHLVPGDIVQLSAGDVVPADCRLLRCRDLYVNQAVLTGESFPVEKSAGDLAAPEAQPAGASNAVFMGTSVVSGHATALVCRTGRTTELGGLAGSLAAHRPRDAFEQGVRDFGMLMLRFTIFLVLFVLAANVLFNRPWLESLLFAIALAVGLTPELLPMVFTVTLARGARRLADLRVIVKRLAAVHDLGAMNILCTDKTGTLTAARIGLASHVDADGNDDESVFAVAYLNSVFESGIKSPLDHAITSHQSCDTSQWRKIDEVPFDFERRRVTVLLEKAGERQLIVKGAPEDIIALCADRASRDGASIPLDADARARLLSRFEELGERGYRVLAVATRAMGPEHESAIVGDETALTFKGFLAFIDPPKPDAAKAVRDLAAAGVAVKILTGDNERITRHVCREIGVEVTGLISGEELSALSQEALRARLAATNVFCRVTPPQKERILNILKHGGNTVGFLGDGVNDASALRAADVGISVDSGSDVAKEAADLVLLDHDLGVVLDGVREGRRTVENMTKYILMGSSSNLGNMFSMAAAALFLPFLPMLPTQVLLNNLLYDLSEVGVPFDDVDPERIERPAQWNMREIEHYMLALGPLSSVFDLVTFWALIALFGADQATFQTGWFIESLATQSLVVLVIRTRRHFWLSRPSPILAGLSIGVVVAGLLIVLSPLGDPFGFETPPPAFFVFLVVTALTYLAMVEFVKQRFYRASRNHGQLMKGVLR